MTVPTRIGRYAVIELLGRGAMGVVYRARDEALERDVALKLMSAQVSDAEGRQRFLREAKAAARLQHPNIITIYELGEHEGAPFMALELLEGCDLQRAIEAGIRPNPRMTLPVLLHVLAGLGQAHEEGIVHRDIKPSNIFLCRRGPAKIMDFGVARLGKGTTTAGNVVGTPYYMSPEQVAGSRVDGRSDLFSVGLILYELVTGEKGYRADSVVSLLFKIAHEAPDTSLLPKDPHWDGVRRVLARALSRDLSGRYETAGSMTDDLKAALSELGGAGPTSEDSGLLIPSGVSRQPSIPLTEPRPAAAPARRFATPAAGLAVLVVLGLLFLLRAQVSPPPQGSPVPVPSILPSPPGPSPSAPIPSPSTLPSRRPPPPPSEPAPSPTERATPPPDPSETADLTKALGGARVALAQNPGDVQAKAVVLKLEAALVVEQRIRMAREALRRGDKETALEEIKLGFAVNPKEPRLLDLFREATR